MHVHIASSDGTAKFWLEPIVALEQYYGLKEKDLTRIEKIVREHRDEFIATWNRHFSQ
jgi:hypothetical protein